jgi:hypothetical protein
MHHSAKILLLFATLHGVHALAQSAISPLTQYFYNQASFVTGGNPGGIAIADINNDGRADLIVASPGGRSMSVLLGQADGTFAPKSDFLLQETPGVLVAGDFNGDGKMDVAVTVETGMAILLGNGDGTLNAPVTYTLTNRPYFLAVSDFNHDGKLDLSLAGDCGDTCGFVSVLLGKGDGTFQAQPDSIVVGVPSAFTVSDLNGDNIPDIALANMASDSVNGGTPGLVVVLLGNGDGTFKAPVNYASGDNIAGIAAGDMNGDKAPDLVVSHYFGATLAVLKGNGDGTFQAEEQVSTDINLGSAFLQLLDLNNDGKLDLVMSSVFNGGAAVLLGNGDGTFQPVEAYSTGGQPYYFAVADVNGDGNTDLAVVDSSGYVTILLGNGNGTFSPRKNLLPGNTQYNMNSVVIADFNSDGKPDAVDSTQLGLAVLLGKGNGSFGQPQVISPTHGTAFSYVAAGDFNGDGHLDLIGDGTTFLPGKGDGTFGTQVQVNSDFNIRSFAVGDFNGDGHLDLLDVGNGFVESQPLQMLLGNGDGTFRTALRSWNLTSIPDKVIAADFNHDGKLDLALTVNPNGVAILLGNGSGSFALPVIYATDSLPNGLTAADVNGDGIVDLIATGSSIDVFLGKGDGTFPNRVDYPIGGFPEQVATGDFNGDGKLDIAVSGNGAGPGYLGILFGNGDGSFQIPLIYTDYAPGGAQVVVSDINGDGIGDILVAAENGSLFLSAPIATVSPSLLSFGSVAPATKSDSMAITVTNSGNGPLHISGATTAAPFSIEGVVCQSALSRLANCTIPVVFDSPMLGNQSGELLIHEDAINSKPMVLLTGTAANPTLTVTPSSLNFSSEAINVTSAAQTVTLTNTSSVVVAITSVTASGSFTATSQCGATLSPSSNCLISVLFTPTATGQLIGSLSISDDALGSPQSIALTGTGVAELAIASQAGGSTSATVKSGATATYALALAAGQGFSGTVSLACSGAPIYAACNIQPTSLALSSGGSGNFTVTTSTSQQTAMNHQRDQTVQFCGIGILLGVSLLPFAFKRSRLASGVLLIVALVSAATIIGCGGSSAAKTPSTQTVTPGSYQLTVTASSGSVRATQTLTLIVQ